MKTTKNSLPGQVRHADTQRSFARQGTHSDSSQVSHADTQPASAAVGLTSPQAIRDALIPNLRAPVGDQLPDPTSNVSLIPILASSGQGPAPAASANSQSLIPSRSTPGLLEQYAMLAFLAATLDDLENLRKAQENRYRSLTTTGVSEKGHEWGFGLPKTSPLVLDAEVLVDGIAAVEKKAVAHLEDSMRKHPLGPWVKAQVGIGDKQAARLLAAIGDPYWNTLYGKPRTVSELWSYCGLAPGQRRAKGQKANWSAEAKMRAWVCIQSCMLLNGVPDKNGRPRALSPYRVIIDERRAWTAGRLHSDPCPRCGPKGKPAAAGSPWSPAHSLADGVRIACKTLLRDLWLEARRIHEG